MARDCSRVLIGLNLDIWFCIPSPCFSKIKLFAVNMRVNNSLGNLMVVPKTSSAAEHCESVLIAVRIPNITNGRNSVH